MEGLFLQTPPLLLAWNVGSIGLDLLHDSTSAVCLSLQMSEADVKLILRAFDVFAVWAYTVRSRNEPRIPKEELKNDQAHLACR